MKYRIKDIQNGFKVNLTQRSCVTVVHLGDIWIQYDYDCTNEITMCTDWCKYTFDYQGKTQPFGPNETSPPKRLMVFQMG